MITHNNPDHRSEQHGSESAPECVGDEGSNHWHEIKQAGVDVAHVCCGIRLHVVAADQVAREGDVERVARHCSRREETCIFFIRARARVTISKRVRPI